jgi:hypothetical protein
MRVLVVEDVRRLAEDIGRLRCTRVRMSRGVSTAFGIESRLVEPALYGSFGV